MLATLCGLLFEGFEINMRALSNPLGGNICTNAYTSTRLNAQFKLWAVILWLSLSPISIY